ncbi:amidase [Rhodococcus sp. (in: high G+C Gram-positive bacteria)]|uniref:amidase n=1 Tax=Rhodococcus sp. TaxID=1831 RepID=UPI00257BFF71|nr:amidase [Rhodococcus sp. (in: high G+C Gram-positive bacteria)]MBQ7806931.1 amidase [Rhodococcus sp. (in: high G+C Gram-positive bacteria)]
MLRSARILVLSTVIVSSAIGLTSGCHSTQTTNSPATAASATRSDREEFDVEDAAIVDLQNAIAEGRLTSEDLTATYLERIETLDPQLGAVVTVNPDAIDIARSRDQSRRDHGPLSPLDGIPVLLKDNMDTADNQPTTAGSTALLNSRPSDDAFLVDQLRKAGAVILGKTNMSEWANFRSPMAIAGWSATGGQTHNPYVLDRSPCGSSSGSAVAAAASLAAVTIGTDTDGSIACPASVTSTVGIKPSLGLVSRSGVVPITSRHDSPGPMGRSVEDAALALSVIYGSDPSDPDSADVAGSLPADFQNMLDPNSLSGKRIGIWREGRAGIDPDVDRTFDAAVEQLQDLGATAVEVNITTDADVVSQHLLPAVLTEFKHDINQYLANTPGEHPGDLTGLIEYNRQNAQEELTGFGQELFEMADQTDGNLSDPTYRAHREAATGRAQTAIDDALVDNNLDAIVTPTELPAPGIDYRGGGEGPQFASSTRTSALAGYPMVTVPSGYAREELPLGLSFLGTRLDDAKLISFAYAYEHAAQIRKSPSYLPTLP